MRKFLQKTKAVVSLFLFLAAILYLSSCQKEQKKQPLRILTDLFCCERAGLHHVGDGIPQLEDYLQYYGITGGDFTIEVLPLDEEKRTLRLTQLRTEIMAGNGPDVFILRCDVPNRTVNDWEFFGYDEHSAENLSYRECLFSDVAAVMDNSIFLPLDDFIKSAEYFDPDLIETVILEAGKTEEGQMVLPLTVTFPYAVYRKSALQNPDNMPSSWKEACNSKDPAIRNAYGLAAWNQFSDLFGKFSDYDTESLSFSREELLHRINSALNLKNTEIFGIVENRLQEMGNRWKGEAIPTNGFDGLLQEKEIMYSDLSLWSPGYYDNRQKEELNSQVLAPIYNFEGGITAGITSYACINRNTQYPQEAFDLLDLFFKTSTQSFWGEYDSNHKCHQTILLSYAYGVPARKDLLSDSEHAFGQRYISEIGINPGPNEEVFAEYTALREEVTHARFYGVLDQELQAMYEACLEAESDKEIEKIVSKAYSTMEKMLAES